jgi:ribosomal protein S18 acetylase RimI-like enzyme
MLLNKLRVEFKETIMQVSCRLLGKNDSSAYRVLRLESLQLHPELYGASFKEQSELNKLYFQTLLEEESEQGAMIGAFIGEKLVGLCGLLSREDGRSLEVVQMYVSQAFRGRSLGSIMLQKAKSVLDSRIENELTLTVYKLNTAAIDLYQKSKFELIDQSEKEYRMSYQCSKLSISRAVS